MAFSSAGFTLLDVLVAIALCALTAVLIMPLLRAPSSDRALDVAVREIGNRLRTARLEAIRVNAEQGVVFDLANRSFLGPGLGSRRVLPSGTEIAVELTASDAMSSKLALFRFFPDGSASGGQIQLRSGSRSARIVVDWLSGHVRTENGR
ncbi:MAG: GspH/FimT family pseudopilin [Hyphomicrobiaceae bacterium]